jgi:hypothetical protein
MDVRETWNGRGLKVTDKSQDQAIHFRGFLLNYSTASVTTLTQSCLSLYTLYLEGAWSRKPMGETQMRFSLPRCLLSMCIFHMLMIVSLANTAGGYSLKGGWKLKVSKGGVVKSYERTYPAIWRKIGTHVYFMSGTPILEFSQCH